MGFSTVQSCLHPWESSLRCTQRAIQALITGAPRSGVSGSTGCHRHHPQHPSFQPSSVVLSLLPSVIQFPWCISWHSFSSVLIQGADKLLNHDPRGSPYGPFPSKSQQVPSTLSAKPTPRRMPFLGPSPLRDDYAVVITVLIIKAVGLLTER